MTDELSTKAIRALIESIIRRNVTRRRDAELFYAADEARAELAALLKRIEEQETQIAVMRNALAATPPTAGSRRP